ncbi:MAG: sulfatase [Planctomycetes bacterium]|nr:sulfatase [Planctomycetota bacterium]
MRALILHWRWHWLLVATVLLGLPAGSVAETVVLQAPFAANGGQAFTVALPSGWVADDMTSNASRVELFEDGHALGPAHAPHADVRALGGGRYSHWQGTLYFSSSDGSDPNVNGRRYEARVEPLPPGRERYVSIPPRDPFVLMDRDDLVQAVAGGLPPLGDETHPAPRLPRLVYWYTIDALRADTAFEVVEGSPLMPALTAFADEAVRFDTAYASSSFTKISTASMFTGLSPVRHRVMHGVQPVWPAGGELVFDLDPRFYTLAEFMRDLGYETATHVYTIHVRPGDGMLQGFARTDLAAGKRAPLPEMPERLFAYEHILGVHGPYDPSPAARSALHLARPGHIDPASTDWFSQPIDDLQMDELRDAYRAEAVDADALLGERLDWIRAQGLWDDAVIVVTADHGEAFGEHGATQHTTTLYEETVRVPLLVHFPAWHRWSGQHGEHLRNRVGLVDVYATLVEMLAGSPDVLPYALDGRSLGPILDGDETDPLARDLFLRTTFTTTPAGAGGPVLLTADAILAGPLKGLLGYRMTANQCAGEHPYATGDWYSELYDVTRDPGERRDVLGTRQGDLERLVERMRERLRPLAARGSEASETSADVDALDPELLEKLRSLGYLR